MKQDAWERYNAARRDFLTGILLFLVFGVILWGSFRIKVVISDGVVTARFFPVLISCIGMGLSAALALVNVFQLSSLRAKAVDSGEEEPHPGNRWGMVLLSIALMGCYVFLIQILGFILASALYLFAQILILEQKRSLKRILVIALISIGVPLIIYFPFRYIFYLIFPTGIFGF